MATALANAFALHFDPRTGRRGRGYRLGGRYVDDCGHLAESQHDMRDIMRADAYPGCNLVWEDLKNFYIFLGLELRTKQQFLLCNPKAPNFRNIVSGRSALSDKKLKGVAQGIFCRTFDQSDSLTWRIFGSAMIVERFGGLLSCGFPRSVIRSALERSRLPSIDVKKIETLVNTS